MSSRRPQAEEVEARVDGMINAIAQEAALHLNPGVEPENVAFQAELWTAALNEAGAKFALVGCMRVALANELKRRGM